VTDTDKLLMLALEAYRPDQVDRVCTLARQKGWSLAETVAEVMRTQLNGLPWEDRQEVIELFKEEAGIDLEELP
jgi:hypothetical protein